MRVRVLNVMEGTVFPSLMGVHHSFFTACERPPPIVENDDDETATAAELNGWTNLETTMPLAIALDEYEANILSLLWISFCWSRVTRLPHYNFYENNIL